MLQQHQYSLALIKHEVNNSVIDQRTGDGYINATALCKAGGKEWGGYKRNDRTIRFLDALCADMRICMSELIQEVRGGNPHEQGTWVHPKVAVDILPHLSLRLPLARKGRGFHTAKLFTHGYRTHS